MPKPIKILTFAGSTRESSYNKKLVRLACKKLDDQKIQNKFIDLRDFPLPFYDGDLEAKGPYPEKALELKNILKSHDAFLIASPEYNSSISAVLKNTIDWLSRYDNKGDLSAFSGKVVAVVSASPGQLGGLRGLNHIRSILTNIGCFVIPNQLAINQAHMAFDEKGLLSDPTRNQQFDGIIQALVQTAKRFNVDLEDYCSKVFGDYCKEQMAPMTPK